MTTSARPRHAAANVAERARRVRCLVLDVDGVLTDCKLYVGPDGVEWKAVHVRDGLGLMMLMRAGIEVAIISGRPSEAMRRRFQDDLGVRHIFLGVEDKQPVFDALLKTLKLSEAQTAVMGDDVPDLALMRRAGFALTVADAHPQALAAAHWTSRLPGGNGAVREAVDLILAAQGKA